MRRNRLAKSLSASIVVIGFTSMLLTACQSTSSGIGGGPSAEYENGSKHAGEGVFDASSAGINHQKNREIKVLDIDFTEALELAHDAANKAFSGRAIVNQAAVMINNQNFWLGDVQAAINPILIQDLDSKEAGFIYETVATGVGFNASMAPGYVSVEFFKALGEIVEERGVTVRSFSHHRQSSDKGVAEIIAASIPVDQVQFRKYIDSFEGSDPFIGVWQIDSGEYTLGMVRDERATLYKYKMFVLDSQFNNWSPGEIKLKFSRLDQEGLAVAKYLRRDKASKGLSFESKKDLLVAINSPFGKPVILIKTYPVNANQLLSGSGTSWHVGDGFFVTNVHVVEGARTIDLMINGDAVPARVAVLDTRLDVAIIKANSKIDLPSIPVGDSASIGQPVTVIGYPLGNALGNTPKITDGLLSGTSGLNGDPTRYLVSAPIQPGNSGGPVFGDDGNVIGIAVSKISSETTDSIGFAIKANYLIPLLEELGVPIDRASYPNLAPDTLCDRYCDAVIQVNTR